MSHLEIRKASKRLTLAITVAASSLLSANAEPALADHAAHGPIYRTLDSLAGGIECAISVTAKVGDRIMRRKTVTCDDGCDAALLHELSHSPDVIQDKPAVRLPIAPPMSEDAQDVGPESSSDQMQMAPVFPEPYRQPPVIQARPIPTPQSVPMRTAPRTQQNNRKPANPTPPIRTPEEEWLDSFPAESNQAVPNDQRPGSKAPRLRDPSETYDSLPDPFLDDPQTSLRKGSSTQPVSYWEPW